MSINSLITNVFNPLHRGNSALTTKPSTNKFGIDPKNIKPPSSENSTKILAGPPTGRGSIAAFKGEVKSQKGLGVSAKFSKMMKGSKPISKHDRSAFQTAKKKVGRGLVLSKDRLNQFAKLSGSVAQFVKDAGNLVASAGIGMVGAAANTATLGVGFYKELEGSAMMIGQLGTGQASFEDKVHELADQSKDGLSDSMITELETMKEKIDTKKSEIGKKLKDLGAAAALFAGSIPGAIGALTTGLSLVGAPAATAVGAVAAGAAMTIMAPAGLLIGGVTTMGINGIRLAGNYTKLTEAKAELNKAHQAFEDNPNDLKAKNDFIKAEKKVGDLKAAIKTNVKKMAVGAGLTVAGAGLAAAAATGVGAPIVVGIGLGVASLGLISSGDPISDVKQFLNLEKPPLNEGKINSEIKNLERENDSGTITKEQMKELQDLKDLKKDMGFEKIEGQKDMFGSATFHPATITKDEANTRFNLIKTGGAIA